MVDSTNETSTFQCREVGTLAQEHWTDVMPAVDGRHAARLYAEMLWAKKDGWDWMPASGAVVEVRCGKTKEIWDVIVEAVPEFRCHARAS